MAGAEREPDEMRHHEAEEGDDAAHRDRGADAGGDADHGGALHPLDGDARVVGVGLAEGERIEAAGKARGEHDAGRGRRAAPAPP